MPSDYEQLKMRVEILERYVASLQNASQVDPLTAKTLTAIISTSSTKTAASATQAVNEGGAGTYNVMFPPSGFISIGGFNVPYI